MLRFKFIADIHDDLEDNPTINDSSGMDHGEVQDIYYGIQLTCWLCCCCGWAWCCCGALNGHSLQLVDSDIKNIILKHKFKMYKPSFLLDYLNKGTIMIRPEELEKLGKAISKKELEEVFDSFPVWTEKFTSDMLFKIYLTCPLPYIMCGFGCYLSYQYENKIRKIFQTAMVQRKLAIEEKLENLNELMARRGYPIAFYQGKWGAFIDVEMDMEKLRVRDPDNQLVKKMIDEEQLAKTTIKQDNVKSESTGNKNSKKHGSVLVNTEINSMAKYRKRMSEDRKKKKNGLNASSIKEVEDAIDEESEESVSDKENTQEKNPQKILLKNQQKARSIQSKIMDAGGNKQRAKKQSNLYQEDDDVIDDSERNNVIIRPIKKNSRISNISESSRNIGSFRNIASKSRASDIRSVIIGNDGRATTMKSSRNIADDKGDSNISIVRGSVRHNTVNSCVSKNTGGVIKIREFFIV